MKIAAIIAILIGAVLFAIGWLLNMNTPMQNRLPVFGLVLIGLGVLALLVRGLFT